MTRPAYIDEHTREISAAPEVVWDALMDMLGRLSPRLPDPLAAAWGLQPRSRRGPWNRNPTVRDTIPGFAVAASDPAHRLVLTGRHRFSDYELHFTLEQGTGGSTELTATTFADFPGLRGAVYRALVITSGAHRIAVQRMLDRVAQRTQR